MQQVFAESWPFRSTGYIVARIHIHRTNLIGDEIHHHLVLASEKYDAMTTCWPQPLKSHSGKTTEELLFNK